ncbi:MAG: cytidyltransferase [Chitinophagaceae bacterium]|nr:MAG: cytidyltransferase [Chitinophagaceae bacterium]
MTKAFVFGKFLPFHKGHEAMIKFALQHCGFLSVLICSGNRESVDGETRKYWITETLSADQLLYQRVEVKVFDYDEDDLPNSSVSSRSVSESWSMIFKQLFPDHDLLVTSEPYGSFVAEYMNIMHLDFDIPRKLVPVSASAVRSDLQANWQFLPSIVKRHYAIRVVVLGTESTGKTTLCSNLASHFKCSLVTEAGRDLIADSRQFEFGQLMQVAEEHARRIMEVTLTQSPLVIIDTDIHITKSYARFVFGRELTVDADVYEANLAQLYLYLDKEVAYIQDGTRLPEPARNMLDRSHRQELAQHGITFSEVSGTWEQRFQQSVDLINLLLASVRLQ